MMNRTDYNSINMPANTKAEYYRHHRPHHHLHATRQMLDDFVRTNLITTATNCIDDISCSSDKMNEDYDEDNKITLPSYQSRDAFKTSKSCPSNRINCEKNLPPRMPLRGRLIINDTDLYHDDDDDDIKPSQTSMTSVISITRNHLINDNNDTNAVKLQPSFDILLSQPQDRWFRTEESDKNQEWTSPPIKATEVFDTTDKTIDLKPMIPTRRCSNHFNFPDHHYLSYDESNQLVQRDSSSDMTATSEMSVKYNIGDNDDDDDHSFVSALTENDDFLTDQKSSVTADVTSFITKWHTSNECESIAGGNEPTQPDIILPPPVSMEYKWEASPQPPQKQKSHVQDVQSTGSSDSNNIFCSALSRLAEDFCRGVRVKNHTYHLRTYENTFVGKEAVDYMVESKMAPTREDAVFIGQRLMKELHLFHHVCFDHTFKDAYLFYRYTDVDRSQQTSKFHDSSSSSELTEKSLCSVNKEVYLSPLRGSRKLLLKLISYGGNSLSSSSDSTGSRPTTTLREIGDIFRREISLSSRTYRFQKFKYVFVGNEAVDRMLELNLAETRIDAVFLGQRLLEEIELFHHVNYRHQFKDDFLFYRFSNDYVPSKSVDVAPLHPSFVLQDTTKEDSNEHFYDIPVLPRRRDSIDLSDVNIDNEISMKDIPCQNTISKRKKPKKKVTFHVVQTRVFENILDIHPATSTGPSIGIGWRYNDMLPTPVIQGTKREGSYDLILPRQVREKMLIDLGYSQKEINNAIREVTKLKKQRKVTMNNFTTLTMVQSSPMRDATVNCILRRK
jgi:hypothetical protein